MLRAVTPCSDDDDSLLSSDCPEEVVWPPVAGDASGGSDCYAAVNLMTMSVSQAAAAATPGASPASPLTLAPPVPAPPADLEQYGSTATAAVACPPAVASRMGPVDLADLSQVLPPAKVAELVFLNHELELAVHEAHAANAAVAAVAHVLASKQAVALRSREMAGAATKRLRRFMAELDTQVSRVRRANTRGWAEVGGSRQRCEGRHCLVGWAVDQAVAASPAHPDTAYCASV